MNVHQLSPRRIQTYFELVQLAGELMQEASDAHAALDLYNVPRKGTNGDYTLVERIDLLVGEERK